VLPKVIAALSCLKLLATLIAQHLLLHNFSSTMSWHLVQLNKTTFKQNFAKGRYLTHENSSYRSCSSC
jgi:hypothetical protein